MKFLSRIFRSPLLRLLGVAIAGTLICGFIDGSMWRSTSPNIGYRAGFFFALMLLFGWRGFTVSYLIFFVVKLYRLGLDVNLSTELLYLICYLLSYAGAFLLARRIAGDEPWLSGERSTRAFLLGAFLAPSAPALLLMWHPFLLMLGLPAEGGPSLAIVNWLRETAGILAITPFILVWLPRSLKVYPGGRAESEKWPPLVFRDVLALALELVAWTAALWTSVYFVQRYHLNLSYLTFIPPLAFATRHRVPLVTTALAANAVLSTTLWDVFGWEHAVSAGELRLLIAIYSLTILVLASVAEERRLFGERIEMQAKVFGRQKLESLGVLANGIAHDFNNLLGSILAVAENLEADMPVDSSAADDVHRIKNVTIRGAEIVRELMIYAGQDQARPAEHVDVSQVVEEMLELLKVSISKHAVLRTMFPQTSPTVSGNVSQIRQVVMNLVMNASEAIGEKDGVIAITIEQVHGGRDLAPSWPSSLPLGDYVRLQVSDTGNGIAAEPIAKIFDPFFSTKFAGRGLGLAVVQGIVRDHNGAIHVVSTPGAGATFQVLLPSFRKEAPEVQSSLAPAVRGQSSVEPLTILVVEDEEILRMAVAKALRRKGFSVLEAGDGSAAMDMIRGTNNRNIDLILLDLTIPGAQGTEIVEAAYRMHPAVSVIVTSAYGKETVDAAFAGHRIERFIRKPFRLSEIVGVIGDLLSAKAY